jgi:Cytochrome domain of cellobiose dehydrogenase
VPFCDALTSICYASYTSELGIAYRVAIPNVTDEAVPTDAILQIVAPISVGWSGFTWGGSMLGNPLSVGWSSGNGAGHALISSRYTT